MTKEEAKHLSEVIKAYSEGKTIQLFDENANWVDLEGEIFFCKSPNRYRIKPENKIRPYKNAEEFLKAYKEHGPFIKDEKEEAYLNVTAVFNDFIVFDTYIRYYTNLLKYYKWQDGTPCGIIE